MVPINDSAKLHADIDEARDFVRALSDPHAHPVIDLLCKIAHDALDSNDQMQRLLARVGASL